VPGSLGQLAAALRRAADSVRDDGALECAHAAGQGYLRVLRDNTPVETGALLASERVDRISGGGSRATVTIGAHTVYAAFRETGGTITAKRFPQLGNPRVGWFGKEVTQAGSHYFARTNTWADGGGLDEICHEVIRGFLFRAGL
jgi:hypothetical protein